MTGDPQAQRAAFFEAGHATGAWLEGFPIERLCFRPEEGDIWIEIVEPELPSGALWNHRDRANAKALVRALLFGPAAQEKFSFGACSPDLDLADSAVASEVCVWRAIDIAGRIPSYAPVLPSLYRFLRITLDRPEVWHAVTIIAQMLLECGEMTGCEVDELARHAFATAGAAPWPSVCPSSHQMPPYQL